MHRPHARRRPTRPSPARRLRTLAPVALLTLLGLEGCATQPPANDPEAVADYRERNDPYEPLNRKSYAVDMFLDKNLLRPVATFYRDDVPETVRTHLHNTLSNLGNPAQFANDVMQGHPRKAGNTFMRLVLNTTVGVGGVFDVAKGLGFPDHDNDFGLTLAVWGLPGGPFLFLPVLGPSDPRDAVGYGANTVLDPLTWVSFGGSNTLGWSRFGLGAVDSRARVLDQTNSIESTALDPYATYRSLYQQHRAGEVANARTDLPQTVPDWFNVPPPPPAPRAAVPPNPGPSVVPSPSLTP